MGLTASTIINVGTVNNALATNDVHNNNPRPLTTAPANPPTPFIRVRRGAVDIPTPAAPSQDGMFAIPYYQQFKPSQIQMVIDENQHVGVPFLLNPEQMTARRPRSKKIQITTSCGSIKRGTVNCFFDTKQTSTLEFKYDASCSLECNINFSGYPEYPAKSRPKKMYLTFLSFLIPKGLNMTWKSDNPNNVRIAIPTDDNTHPSGAKELYKLYKRIIQAHEVLGQNPPANSLSPPELIIQLRPVTADSNLSYDGSGIGSEGVSVLGKHIDMNKIVVHESTHFVTTGITTALVNPSNGKSVVPSSSSKNPSMGGKIISMKSRCQYVLVGSNPKKLIYYDIYGLCHGNNAERGEEAAEDDSTDCIICLTETREYACIPCRHLCMCHNCVGDLASHGNKCPMCRKHVQLFLRYGYMM